MEKPLIALQERANPDELHTGAGFTFQVRHRVSGRRLDWRLEARAFSSIDLNFQTVSLVSVSPGSRKRPPQNAGNEWTGLPTAG